MLGNKGGVAIAFTFDATRLLFITAHFAAHEKMLAQRNADFHRINKMLFLPKAPGVFLCRYKHITYTNTHTNTYTCIHIPTHIPTHTHTHTYHCTLHSTSSAECHVLSHWCFQNTHSCGASRHIHVCFMDTCVCVYGLLVCIHTCACTYVSTAHIHTHPNHTHPTHLNTPQAHSNREHRSS